MKKALSLLLTIVALTAICAFSASALDLTEASNAMITFGQPVTADILKVDEENTHLFELSDSGNLNITLNSAVPYFTLTIYDAQGTKLWGEDAKCNGKTYTKSVPLTAGSYYFDVLCYNKKYGSYNLLLTFDPSGESFKETQGGSNNTIVNADNNVLSLGKKYTGFLALNDYDDYFKVQLGDAGVVTLNIESEVALLKADFYDGNGNKAWGSDVKLENGKKTIDVALTAGTYYFHVYRSTNNYGAYSFTLDFAPANETVVEAQNGSNNKAQVASKIDVNKDIGGVIAYNDLDDYYTFTLKEAGTLEIQLTSAVNSFKVEFLDSDGKDKMWSADAGCAGYTYYNTFDITAGTYYFHIYRNKDFYGAYNLKLKFIPSGESFKEAPNGSNNTVEKASDIQVNKLYTGSIGINDTTDYYCFSLASMDKIDFTLNSEATCFTLRILDSKGNRIVNEDAYCKGQTFKKTLQLSAGLFYIQIARLNEVTGTYTFTISGKQNNASNVRTTNFGSVVSTWAVAEAEEANKLGLIPAVLLGTDLTEKVNRAEFAAIAVKLYEHISNSKIYMGENPFNDISSNKFMNEIIKASTIGITSGTSDTTFSPNSLITREQMATMLCRAYKKKAFPDWTVDTDAKFPLKTDGAAKFSDDGKISGYAKEAVYFMASKGIINGVDDAGVIFAPKNDPSKGASYGLATREQAIIIALRCAKNL